MNFINSTTSSEEAKWYLNELALQERITTEGGQLNIAGNKPKGTIVKFIIPKS
jgi:hypothetical protein